MTLHEALGDMISLAWAMTGAVSADPTLSEAQRSHVTEAFKRIEAARDTWRKDNPTQ